jgi:predicted RNA methylase
MRKHGMVHLHTPVWRRKIEKARKLGIRSALRRLFETGLWANIRWSIGDLLDRNFDRRYNVDTAGFVLRSDIAETAVGSHGALGHNFKSTPEYTLRKAFDRLPEVQGFTFIDYGCGKGRPVLLAMTMPFRRIIGIEHNPQLAEIAEKNLRTWNGQRRCGSVEVVCADALEYDLPLERLVLFFFGPFAEPSLYHLVMEKVLDSLKAKPREIYILHVDAATQNLSDEILQASGFQKIPGR